MKKRLLLLALAVVSMVGLVASPTTRAVDVFGGCNGTGVDCGVVKDNSLDYRGSNNRVWGMIALALSILAGVAVIVIVIAGLRYTLSAGDSSKVAAAKNTLLYAVIGLVVALSAAIIVALVTQQFG